MVAEELFVEDPVSVFGPDVEVDHCTTEEPKRDLLVAQTSNEVENVILIERLLWFRRHGKNLVAVAADEDIVFWSYFGGKGSIRQS